MSYPDRARAALLGAALSLSNSTAGITAGITAGMTAGITAGCTAHSSYDYKSEPDPRLREYVIGASDVVRITVWKNVDLSIEGTVRPDGTITVPLVGDLAAAGHTPSELQSMMGSKVSQFIKGPDVAPVTVAVTSVNSYRYTVSGNFERPGVFSNKYYVTIVEAVALAGGLNRFANPHRLLLVRTDNRGTRTIPVDFERIASGRFPDENLALFRGDLLVAP